MFVASPMRAIPGNPACLSEPLSCSCWNSGRLSSPLEYVVSRFPRKPGRRHEGTTRHDRHIHRCGLERLVLQYFCASIVLRCCQQIGIMALCSLASILITNFVRLLVLSSLAQQHQRGVFGLSVARIARFEALEAPVIRAVNSSCQRPLIRTEWYVVSLQEATACDC